MSNVTKLVILAGTVLVAGCASQPPPAASATGATHQSFAEAPSAVPQPQTTALEIRSTPPQTASLTQASASAPAAAKEVKETVTHPNAPVVVINGRRLVCDLEFQTGSRIPQRVCRTEEQVKEEERRAKQLAYDIMRQSAEGKQVPLECGGANMSARPGC